MYGYNSIVLTCTNLPLGAHIPHVKSNERAAQQTAFLLYQTMHYAPAKKIPLICMVCLLHLNGGVYISLFKAVFSISWVTFKLQVLKNTACKSLSSITARGLQLPWDLFHHQDLQLWYNMFHLGHHRTAPQDHKESLHHLIPEQYHQPTHTHTSNQ